MGFFSFLGKSWKKSSRLQELQKIISPPNQSVNELASDLLRSFESGNNEKERALEDFLDLCESDAGVKKVMEIEHLSRSDLEELYQTLLKVGLGQWVKGHYAALSTLAYGEPLLYAVRAQKQGVNLKEIAIILLDYWEDKLPSGGLFRQV